jgi:hypothetical protein
MTVAGSTTPDWYCNYPATVETVPGNPRQIVVNESRCDGVDNDCDGAADEHTMPRVGTTCMDMGSGLGECRRSGTNRCNPSDPLAQPVCDTSGSSARNAENEVCDGKDNDCDGIVDESWDNPATASLNLPKCSGVDCLGIRDETATIPSSTVRIYRYEASRVDANGSVQGTSTDRPCSRPGVVPWSLVNYTQAAAACTKIGMRLCSASEWGNACKGNQSCTADYFPYSCSFNSTACNGAEKGLNASRTTGAEAACTTLPAGGTALWDMSGNLAEWTSQQNGMIAGKRIFILRGGSFNNFEPALRCDSSLLAFAEDYSFLDAGFRCCSNCAAGMAECSGSCVNMATSNSHCGLCGRACSGGNTCKNGECKP